MLPKLILCLPLLLGAGAALGDETATAAPAPSAAAKAAPADVAKEPAEKRTARTASGEEKPDLAAGATEPRPGGAAGGPGGALLGSDGIRVQHGPGSSGWSGLVGGARSGCSWARTTLRSRGC